MAVVDLWHWLLEELASEMVTSRLSSPLGMESEGMVLGDGDTIGGGSFLLSGESSRTQGM